MKPINQLLANECHKLIEILGGWRIRVKEAWLRELAGLNGITCEQSTKDQLITKAINQLVMLHQWDPRGLDLQEWPTQNYRDAACSTGLNYYEELNYEVTGKLPKHKETDTDEMEFAEDLHPELYNDETTWYYTPFDWDKLAELVTIQLQIEELMLQIDYHDSRVVEERTAAKKWLDWWYHNGYGRVTQKRRREKLEELKDRNTRARIAAMGIRDKVDHLWDEHGHLIWEAKCLVGTDKSIWRNFFSFFMSIDRDATYLRKTAWRKWNIKWMKDFIKRYDERERDDDIINPYWIIRSDEGAREIDDPSYQKDRLGKYDNPNSPFLVIKNLGALLANEHLREQGTPWYVAKDNPRDTVHIKTGGTMKRAIDLLWLYKAWEKALEEEKMEW